MLIPWQDLSPETLENLKNALCFFTEHGYDPLVWVGQTFGHDTASGEAVLVWSELHETVNIMPRSQFRE